MRHIHEPAAFDDPRRMLRSSLGPLDVTEQLVGALEALLQYLRRPALVIFVVIPGKKAPSTAERRDHCEDPYPHRLIQQGLAKHTVPPLVIVQMGRAAAEILPVQLGGNSCGQNFPPTSRILLLAS